MDRWMNMQFPGRRSKRAKTQDKKPASRCLNGALFTFTHTSVQKVTELYTSVYFVGDNGMGAKRSSREMEVLNYALWFEIEFQLLGIQWQRTELLLAEIIVAWHIDSAAIEFLWHLRLQQLPDQ